MRYSCAWASVLIFLDFIMFAFIQSLVILFKHKAMQYSDSSNILCNKNLPLCLLSLQQTFSQEKRKKNLHSSHLLHFLVFQTILWDVAVFAAVIVWSRLCREQLISLAKGTETSFNHWPISELLSFWILLPISSVSFIPPSLQVTTSLPIFCLCPPVCQLPASPVSGTQGGFFSLQQPTTETYLHPNLNVHLIIKYRRWNSIQSVLTSLACLSEWNSKTYCKKNRNSDLISFWKCCTAFRRELPNRLRSRRIISQQLTGETITICSKQTIRTTKMQLEI